MIPQIELGRSGERIPILAIGTYGFRDEKRLKIALIHAFDCGINHIDTAEMYRGAEEIVGQVIKEVGREKLFITSKVLPSNGSFRKVISSCEASLRRMKTDYIDLYLLHFYTGEYPLDETLSAFEHLREAGKIRYYGVSNFELGEYRALGDVMLKFDIQNNQVEYNLSNFSYVEKQLLPLYDTHRITLSGYSPFFQGRKIERRILQVVKKIAEKHGKTVFQVMLNFLLRTGRIFIIFKSEDERHIRENVDVFSFRLDEEDIRAIEDLEGS